MCTAEDSCNGATLTPIYWNTCTCSATRRSRDRTGVSMRPKSAHHPTRICSLQINKYRWVEQYVACMKCDTEQQFMLSYLTLFICPCSPALSSHLISTYIIRSLISSSYSLSFLKISFTKL